MLQHPKRKKKSYWETKKSSTSSAFGRHVCQVGRLPNYYWKHSETNKHLLREPSCEEGNSLCMIGGTEKKSWESEMFVCFMFLSPTLCQQYLHKISSKANLACDWIVSTSWGHSGSRKKKLRLARETSCRFFSELRNSARMIEDMWAWTAQVPVFLNENYKQWNKEGEYLSSYWEVDPDACDTKQRFCFCVTPSVETTPDMKSTTSIFAPNSVATSQALATMMMGGCTSLAAVSHHKTKLHPHAAFLTHHCLH